LAVCQNGQDFEQPVSGSLLVNNGETMRQMALAGVGIARLDLIHVANDIKAGTLVALLEEHNPGDIENFSAVYVPGGNSLRPPQSHRRPI
jgi:DNA-binding transcriptional LysR family regulator